MSRKIELDDEKIYKLRKKGMGHVAIARLFNVSHTTIARKCKEIFREKGEEEPRTIKKSKFTTKNRLEISDDEIYELYADKYWQPLKAQEQPYEAFAINSKYIVRVFLDKMEENNE